MQEQKWTGVNAQANISNGALVFSSNFPPFRSETCTMGRDCKMESVEECTRFKAQYIFYDGIGNAYIGGACKLRGGSL
jgi:hypothetical protein